MAITKSVITVTVFHNSEYVDKVQLLKDIADTMDNIDYAYEWHTEYEKDGELE